MTLTHFLTAAGCAALLAGAAYAQDGSTTTTTDAQGNTTTTTTTPTTTTVIDPVTGLPISTDASTAGVPASSMTMNPAGAPGTVTARTVASAPIPDTPENRAKYAPLSRAGKRTEPAGN